MFGGRFLSKYNFKLDLDSNNSLKLIIDMIKPNTRILEFGCAHGRLTRYLNEKKNCNVDIVEIDMESGSEAAKYSNRSLIGEELGDIEKYNWLDKLKDEKYDYIIFADVLEHLHFPDKVLTSCNRLLKSDGSIVMSIPNIAHNSILINLVNDEFNYTQVGLLDNTHIHFFSYKSLIRMIYECGYQTFKEEASYCKVGENEISNDYNSISKQLAKELRKREMGNIYQFVFEIKKKDYMVTNSPIKKTNFDINSEYKFVLYVKEANDNSCTEYRKVEKYINPDHNIIKIKLEEFDNIDEIRLDPVDCNCIVDIKQLYTIIENQLKPINILGTNGMKINESIYIFSNEDPQIYLDVKDIDLKEIYCEFDFIDYDSPTINIYETLLNELIVENSLDTDRQRKIISSLNEKLDEKDKKIIGLNKKKDILLEEKNELVNLLQEKCKLLEEANKNITILNNQVENIKNLNIWGYLKSKRNRRR